MRAMLHRKWLRKWLLGTVLVLGLSTHGASSDDGWMPDLHVAAGGQLMFVRPDDFGLAVHRHQLPVQSTIPPCDEGFDYCLYYLGGQFAGTNFRNAGIRIERRDDLETAASAPLGRGNVGQGHELRMGMGLGSPGHAPVVAKEGKKAPLGSLAQLAATVPPGRQHRRPPGRFHIGGMPVVFRCLHHHLVEPPGGQALEKGIGPAHKHRGFLRR